MLGIRRYRGAAIDLFQGDITRFVCDAMVNAANAQLAGGGGVDGAIHRAAGPSLLDECRKLGGCPVGRAVITGPGALPAKHVIHAVGPVWSGGKNGEPALLASAHRESLALGEAHKLRHLAFSAISTGVYGYPLAAAADTALRAVMQHLDERGAPGAVQRITFVLFSKDAYDAFQDALFRIFPDLE